MTELLEIFERVYARWPFLFCAVFTYSFACPFAISWVRAIRLDRQAAARRSLTRMELRALAFAIAAPTTLALAYTMFRRPLEESLVHAVISGAATPMIAQFYIARLEQKSPDDADLFKVGRRPRRKDDPLEATYPPRSNDPNDDTIQEL